MSEETSEAGGGAGSGSSEADEIVWTIPTDELTEVEQRLVQAVTDGGPLILGRDGPSADWGAERHIRAMVIRDLLRGRHVNDPDPQGIWIVGARIVGPLWINGVRSILPLHLVECYLDGGINASNAHLGELVLGGTVIDSPNFPALFADGLRVDGQVTLAGGVFVSSSAEGTVKLGGAQIGGQLSFTGATISNDVGSAVLADAVNVEGSLGMNNASLTNRSELATVRLMGAFVRGQLRMMGAKVVNHAGPSLDAESLVTEGPILLNGSVFSGQGDVGTIRLLEARAGAALNLSSARVSNGSGPALIADGLTVQGLFTVASSTFTGSGRAGVVTLLTADLRSKISFELARVTSTDGPALVAEGISAAGVANHNGSIFVGSGTSGCVNYSAAKFGKQLDFAAATLINESGPAFRGGRMTSGSVRFDNGTFAGRGIQGTIRLPGAHIMGQLVFDNARIANADGPALIANRMNVHSSVFLRPKELSGSSAQGAVHLVHASIGDLATSPEVLERAARRGSHWNVDGLTYQGTPAGVSDEQWLEFLRTGMTSYAAQPYQHLAAQHHAAGHDDPARKTLMDQRRDQIKRAELGKWSKTWAKFTGFALGYGYQPWRALIGLLVVVIIAVSGCLFWPGTRGLEQLTTTTTVTTTVASTTTSTSTCTPISRAAYALHATVPLITTANPCQPTNTPSGVAVQVLVWALSLAAWALLTLFIAGFTNAIRKT